VPNWIIIDIEGFEIAALEGAMNLLQTHPVGLIVEMHANVWDSAQTTREEAEALFRLLGREPVPLTGQRDPIRDHGIVALERTL